jgi:hypothetical protein
MNQGGAGSTICSVSVIYKDGRDEGQLLATIQFVGIAISIRSTHSGLEEHAGVIDRG